MCTSMDCASVDGVWHVGIYFSMESLCTVQCLAIITVRVAAFLTCFFFTTVTLFLTYRITMGQRPLAPESDHHGVLVRL